MKNSQMLLLFRVVLLMVWLIVIAVAVNTKTSPQPADGVDPRYTSATYQHE